MNNTNSIKTLIIAIALSGASMGQAQASSLASSAAGAGSSASDSASNTLDSSSKSSEGDDKVAAGNYRITNITTLANKTDRVRITLRPEHTENDITLDLPTTTWAAQKLAQGDLVHAQPHSYGIEFARVDNQQPFFLVLNDNWHSELASKPLDKQ